MLSFIRKRLGCLLVVFTIFICAGAAAAAYLLAKYDASSYPARWQFYRDYQNAQDKEGAIGGYVEHLNERHKALPEDVAEYLVSRYRTTADEAEKGLLVDFFTKQSGIVGPIFVGAKGHLSPAEAEALAGRLVSKLPTYFEGQKVGALMILEDLRRDKALYKAVLSDKAGDTPANVNAAVGLYRKWFAASLTWDQKQKVDPLEGSTIYWSEP